MPCRIVVPVVIAPLRALPGDRPAAALVAEVVGVPAGHVDAPGHLRERQDAAVVLQQDERLAHGLARRPAGARRSRPGGSERAVGVGLLEEAERDLLAQDAPHGVVDARLRDAAGLDERLQRGDELGVAVGHHDHVDAGVDRGLDVGGVVARAAGRCRPSRRRRSPEAELALEHVGEQVAVAVHLLAVPAAEGGHHGADAGRDRGAVARAGGSRAASPRPSARRPGRGRPRCRRRRGSAWRRRGSSAGSRAPRPRPSRRRARASRRSSRRCGPSARRARRRCRARRSSRSRWPRPPRPWRARRARRARRRACSRGRCCAGR